LIDAVEQIRADGCPVELGVFGAGPLGQSARRLHDLGAEVINQWLSKDEISSILARYDIMVLSHVEASQSGVAATAFGAGMPVVCTPVGGLPEQILDGVTGLVARRADGPALADAIMRLVRDPQLYNAMSTAVVDTQDQRSIARFVEDCVAHARHIV
jgi:glycosyltransferase involved in cell wall biosynthesis